MLKIGDKLYRKVYLSSIFEYEVYEIRQSKDNTQYAIRCNACSDHEKCELLVVEREHTRKLPQKEKEYKFVCMLNNVGEDESEQYYWHETCDLDYETYFVPDIKIAKILTYKKAIVLKEKEIKKYKETIDKKEKEIAELKETLEMLEVKEE